MDEQALKSRVAEVEAMAEIVETRCGHGTMPFRVWNEGAGEPVVLLHGGSGSWTHWIANIDALARHHEVIVPDLPGLGEAATLPQGYSAADAAHWVAEGINRIDALGFHLVGFSWGCIVAAIVAARDNPVLKSLCLVGPAGLGEMPEPPDIKPLRKRTPEMSAVEAAETNRENLARLMIHDREKIDDLAVYLQTINTERSRFNSPQFARTTLVADHLAKVTRPTKVVYGEYDATARPNIAYREELLHHIRSDIEFEVLPGVGHWAQYEDAATFNAMLDDWIERHR